VCCRRWHARLFSPSEGLASRARPLSGPYRERRIINIMHQFDHASKSIFVALSLDKEHSFQQNHHYVRRSGTRVIFVIRRIKSAKMAKVMQRNEVQNSLYAWNMSMYVKYTMFLISSSGCPAFWESRQRNCRKPYYASKCEFTGRVHRASKVDELREGREIEQCKVTFAPRRVKPADQTARERSRLGSDRSRLTCCALIDRIPELQSRIDFQFDLKCSLIL